MFAMVQGNLLAVTLSHLLIATQVGVVAGVLAFIVSFTSRTSSIIVTSLTLGVCTAIVDYLVHSGPVTEVIVEALATGLMAAILSFIVARLLRLYRRRPDAETE